MTRPRVRHPGTRRAASAWRTVSRARRGVPPQLVIGVVTPGAEFRADAWLDGDSVDDELVELTRYPSC